MMSRNTKKIVLTRPVAQAQPMAQRLTALGYSVELFPLLEIATLPDQSELQAILQSTLAHLSNYALAVFVSPNAIHAVFQNPSSSWRNKWPNEVAIAVMGEGSRSVLAQYGINDSNALIYCPTDSLRSDSEALLEQLDLVALRGREAVIFRAETGREFLSGQLIAHGMKVTKVAAYRRFTPVIDERSSRLLIELLSDVNDWVVSSSEALSTLVDMIAKVTGDADVAKLQRVNLLISHQRIATTAKKYGFNCVRLIGSGDENILLALQSGL